MSTKLYSIHIWQYAERHFIKTFEKKYPRAWDITLKAIFVLLERVDEFLLKTSKAEKICTCNEWRRHILKCEFAVAGTRESPHGSGNRYIVYMDEERCECHILLVYCKSDYNGQETTWWKQQIKENYPELKSIFTSL
jgi:hypothetical protein